MEIKTTKEQLDVYFSDYQFDFVEKYDDSNQDYESEKWVRVSELKERLNQIQLSKKPFGRKFETLQYELNNLYAELSQSNDSVKAMKSIDNGLENNDVIAGQPLNSKPSNIPCPSCEGRDSQWVNDDRDVEECLTCKGRGEVEPVSKTPSNTKCVACNGNGYTNTGSGFEVPCYTCKTKGYVEVQK